MAHTSSTVWAPELRLFAADPPGLHAVPGADLVVPPPSVHLTGLPEGTLLDDVLTPADRLALDEEADARYEAWAARRARDFTIDGIDVAWIWADELVREVFVAEVATVRGLALTLGDDGPERVLLNGFDAEVASCLAATLGCETRTVGPAAAPPTYPSLRAAPWRIPWTRRLYRAALATVGMPGLPRGNVLTLPYWHLTELHRRMASEPGLVPMLDPLALPRLAPAELAVALARGGWVGRPNGLRVRRSAGTLASVVARARARPAPGDALDRLLDVRALRLIEQRARDTVAVVKSTERALRRRRTRGLLLPWDSPANARKLVVAARRAGVPVVVVQHGFVNDPRTPDKSASDLAAVWSERDAREMAARGVRAVVTGNPGAPTVPPRAPRPERPWTIVLPEYASPLSARIPERASLRSVQLSLEALQQARPGTRVLVRPHPGDHDPDAYRTLSRRFGALEIEVDQASPIERVIAGADLCIGSVSTATLQAAAAGVPVVYLDVAAAAAPWPFDHSGALPRATDAEALAGEIPRALAGDGQPAAATIAEALGMVADAQERVLALLRETF